MEHTPNISPFELEVQVVAGTPLYDAIHHAKYKCAELGMMYINFNFNGIDYSISNSCNIDRIIEEVERDASDNNLKSLYIE